MLGVLPPSSNLPCNESPKLLTGMNEGGKRSLFHSAFCSNIMGNKLNVFAARFTEASILLAPLALSFKKYCYLVSKPPTVHVKANIV